VSEPAPPSDTIPVSRKLVLLDHLTFAEEQPSGHSVGIDLDCRVSDNADNLGCYLPDLISPEHEFGIDNQLGVLLSFLNSVVGGDLAQTQRTASDGDHGLPVIELLALPDGTFEVSMMQASTVDGASIVRDGTGRALPMQALRIDAASARWLGRAQPTGTRLTLGGVAALSLPLRLPNDHGEVLDVAASTTRAAVSFDIGLTSQGVLAGAISIEELMRISARLGLGSRTSDIVRATYVSAADLGPDAAGDCADVSYALTFDPVVVSEAP